MVYAFTDAYADQFEGPKGKKIKYKQLQEIIVSNSEKPMEEQKNILEKSIEDWQDVLEQIDDVLVIGVLLYIELQIYKKYLIHWNFDHQNF